MPAAIVDSTAFPFFDDCKKLIQRVSIFGEKIAQF